MRIVTRSSIPPILRQKALRINICKAFFLLVFQLVRAYRSCTAVFGKFLWANDLLLFSIPPEQDNIRNIDL